LIPCRTGHAFTSEYYSTFVPLENAFCPCGEHVQPMNTYSQPAAPSIIAATYCVLHRKTSS
ncbi:hypothetical protein EDD16DRAFT_1499686, partial [Pisolithus croceorrhizus]